MCCRRTLILQVALVIFLHYLVLRILALLVTANIVNRRLNKYPVAMKYATYAEIIA